MEPQLSMIRNQVLLGEETISVPQNDTFPGSVRVFSDGPGHENMMRGPRYPQQNTGNNLISSYKLAPMADPSKDELPQEQEAAQLLSQVRQILEETRSFREQAERKRSRLRFFARKLIVRLFLRSMRSRLVKDTQPRIAGVKGTVEADANAIATNKQRRTRP